MKEKRKRIKVVGKKKKKKPLTLPLLHISY